MEFITYSLVCKKAIELGVMAVDGTMPSKKKVLDIYSTTDFMKNIQPACFVYSSSNPWPLGVITSLEYELTLKDAYNGVSVLGIKKQECEQRVREEIAKGLRYVDNGRLSFDFADNKYMEEVLQHLIPNGVGCTSNDFGGEANTFWSPLNVLQDILITKCATPNDIIKKFGREIAYSIQKWEDAHDKNEMELCDYLAYKIIKSVIIPFIEGVEFSVVYENFAGRYGCNSWNTKSEKTNYFKVSSAIDLLPLAEMGARVIL